MNEHFFGSISQVVYPFYIHSLLSICHSFWDFCSRVAVSFLEHLSEFDEYSMKVDVLNSCST